MFNQSKWRLKDWEQRSGEVVRFRKWKQRGERGTATEVVLSNRTMFSQKSQHPYHKWHIFLCTNPDDSLPLLAPTMQQCQAVWISEETLKDSDVWKSQQHKRDYSKGSHNEDTHPVFFPHWCLSATARVRLQCCSSLDVLHKLIEKAIVCSPFVSFFVFVYLSSSTWVHSLWTRISNRHTTMQTNTGRTSAFFIKGTVSFPRFSLHVLCWWNDFLLLTLIGWIKINSLYEQQGFINHRAT